MFIASATWTAIDLPSKLLIGLCVKERAGQYFDQVLAGRQHFSR